LAFGLIGATLLVLLVVPLLYRLYVALTFTNEQMLGFSSEAMHPASESHQLPSVLPSEPLVAS
jgi:hypothetical protein